MSATTQSEFVWEGPGGPFSILLDEGVFVPSSTSRELAAGLEIEAGDTVIDVGSGSGVLSFAAARLGAKKVYGTDVNETAIACATRNAERLGLSEITEFRLGSLFEPLDEVRADVIIGDVSGIPDEIAAMSGWFPGGFSGGPTGAEVPVAMLRAARDHLRPGGRLYLPTGSIQDENAVLRAARAIFEDRMRQMRERVFPLPSKVADSAVVRRLAESGVVNLLRRGSRMVWSLRVWECRLPPA